MNLTLFLHYMIWYDVIYIDMIHDICRCMKRTSYFAVTTFSDSINQSNIDIYATCLIMPRDDSFYGLACELHKWVYFPCTKNYYTILSYWLAALCGRKALQDINVCIKQWMGLPWNNQHQSFLGISKYWCIVLCIVHPHIITWPISFIHMLS